MYSQRTWPGVRLSWVGGLPRKSMTRLGLVSCLALFAYVSGGGVFFAAGVAAVEGKEGLWSLLMGDV
jgi:hypothetical protein